MRSSTGATTPTCGPTLLMTEAIGAIFTTKEHPEYIAALAKRGITDLDHVQIDPWPAGVFGYDCEEGRRITRCISFLRTDPTDNGYARPIEGLIVHFDMADERGDRGDRSRRHAAAAEPRELLRRGPAAACATA